jgi:hypothetical protein
MYLHIKVDNLVQAVANSVTLKIEAAGYSEMPEQNTTLHCVKNWKAIVCVTSSVT